MRAFTESIRDFFGATRNPGDTRVHLDATMQWLCRAQDATGEGGVARMYHLRNGWGFAYPETTGYIIPTFLHYARLTKNGEFQERARQMADWECRVQMPEGAVQGGTVEQPPSPAIFNTGQVLFGWCAAYARLREPRYLAAARRAGDYLLSQQDGDGCWRRNLSRFCSSGTDTYAYNVRTAWALLELAEQSGDERYRAAAQRNVEAVGRLTLGNGWVEKNCLTDATQPLLHTIAYTHQGLFECGIRLGNEQAVAAVQEGGMHLRRRFAYDGQLHGRYDREWNPRVTWRCLTGEAQTAIVWYRIADWTGDAEWRSAADHLTAQVCETQRTEGRPEVVGGVKGSYPVFGQYGQFEYLNWAAKFHADALMLKLGHAAAGGDG
jgi:hypothetical protein